MNETIGVKKRNRNCLRGSYREIITKAVCGTVRKSLQYTHVADMPKDVIVDQILGCTLTHQRLYESKMKNKSNNSVTIDTAGVCVAQIWYAYNSGKETDVLRCSINFKESVPVEFFDDLNAEPMVVKATILNPPRILESAITNDNRIKLEVQLDILAEIIGESKILIPVYRPDNEE